MEDSDDEAPTLVDVAIPPGHNSSAGKSRTIEMDEPGAVPPCPVTILSGFLGSGKTTLIQYILKNPDHGKRIAVIENEFGEGLAVESLIARDGVDPNSDSLREFIELPNGCICCTVKDSLVATLENLIAKRSDLDYILIEASGMANPGPIASVFWLDEALESRLRLDGIVTLVDANHILGQLQTTEEAAQQIAYADRLLVNKIDCLPESKSKHALTEITEALRKLHPTAPILATTYAKVPDLDWILNARCFAGASRLEELNDLWNNSTVIGIDCSRDLANLRNCHIKQDLDHVECQFCRTAHVSQAIQDGATLRSNPAATIGHKHTNAVTTIAFERTGSVSLSKLNAWLAEILWPNQDECNQILTVMLNDSASKEELSRRKKTEMQIFRIKGVVSVVHDSIDFLDSGENKKYVKLLDDRKMIDCRRYIVQAVHDLWEVHPGSDNLQFAACEERVCKILLIGRHLPNHWLELGFQSCFHV